jgi:hypothetical protein
MHLEALCMPETPFPDDYKAKNLLVIFFFLSLHCGLRDSVFIVS